MYRLCFKTKKLQLNICQHREYTSIVTMTEAFMREKNQRCIGASCL